MEQLEKAFAKKKYEQAHHIVYQLYEQLRHLFETEFALLGHTHLRGLKRDPNGQSRIIDVLIDNDLEPVRRYSETLTHTLQNLNSELLGLRK